MHALLIQQSDLSQAEWNTLETPALQPGHVRFRLQHFALSANNITYADLGQSMRYWQFFPAPKPGFGLLPVWGYAEVIESQHAQFQLGERAYGYWPLATEAVLQPVPSSQHGFADSAMHRADLPAVYQYYTRERSVAAERADIEGRYALLRPLFMTSWLCADYLLDQDLFGAEQIILLSASSKTALALGYALRASAAKADVIGLSSDRNLAFVRASNCCNRVLSYVDIEALPRKPSVVVDMAGNLPLLTRVHQHLGLEAVRRSVSVGISHRGDLDPARAEVAGVRTHFFFAPTHVKKRSEQHGAGWIEQNSRPDWNAFLTASASYLPLQRGHGMDAAKAAYLALLAGDVRADLGLIFEF